MLLLLLSLSALAAPTWTELSTTSAWETFKQSSTKNAGEVTLQSATVSGTSCFRGTASVSGISAATLLTVATDIEGALTWSSAGIKDAVTLKKSATNIDYYQYLSVPIISDRFWFLHGTLINEGSRTGLRWEKAWEAGGPYAATYAEVVAAHPRAVEPPVNVGAWLFDADDGTVGVTYIVCTDSGGAIPQGLQNTATKGTLPNTIDDLVKEARRRG